MKNKFILVSAATMLLSSATFCAVSPVLAENASVITVSDSSSVIKTSTLSQSKEALKLIGGYTDEELSGFTDAQVLYMANNLDRLTQSGSEDRAGTVKIIKLILKAYKKLPKWLRKKINKYAKIDTVVRLVEHYTGSVENRIYKALRKVGMSKGMASFTAKTIMLFF